jgi:hypothetical protein
MSIEVEINDRNHEFGKESDPVEQEIAHEVAGRLMAYLAYLQAKPGYKGLVEIQANLKQWPDPKYSPGVSYTFSIVHKTPDE